MCHIYEFLNIKTGRFYYYKYYNSLCMNKLKINFISYSLFTLDA